jgi:hypothetical protein
MTLLSTFTSPLGSCVELYRRDWDGQYFVIYVGRHRVEDRVDRYAREREARVAYDRVVRTIRVAV